MYNNVHYIIGFVKNKIDTIRTLGGKRLYNVNKYLDNTDKNDIKEKIIYARVSSQNQKDNLLRQIEYFLKNIILNIY